MQKIVDMTKKFENCKSFLENDRNIEKFDKHKYGFN